MRARGKSNSGFSIATLLSTTTTDKQGRDVHTGAAANNSNTELAQSSISSRIGRHGHAACDGLQRALSPHLDPGMIRQGMRSPSDISASRISSEMDLLAFMRRHRWNSTRSTTPPLVGSLKLARPEVYSPSVYSRPPSAEGTANVRNGLNAVVHLPEWPLRPASAADEGDKKSALVKTQEAEDIRLPHSPMSLEDKPLPALPESYPSSVTTSRAGSPPKRTVRKRRSIFKFLRPASRRQQIRSMSSPLLLSTQATCPGLYDGPSDEGMLTVQYELTENPRHLRSVSVSNLAQERRPTLAEYECNLTASGDSRRRPSNVTPSAIDLPKLLELQDISEDEGAQEQQQSGRLHRKMSRAHAMDEAGKTLMGQALRKHQRGKALFRSQSKRRESMAVSPSPIPVFSSSPFASTSTSVAPPSLPELDPLENRCPVLDRTYLEPPSDSSVEPSSLRLPTTTRNFEDAVSRQHSTIVSTRASPMPLEKSASVPGRIGTSLSSWTKYPSHTRSLRCGSAGAQPQDKVITRDFAIQVNAKAMSPEGLVSPVSHASSWTAKPKNLIRSPSRTFSRIVQYYTDLFTRPEFRGGNRRTSVSMSSGALVHPELEMLPPVIGAESHQGSGDAHLREIDEMIDADEGSDAVGKGEEGREEERAETCKDEDMFAVRTVGNVPEDEEASPFDGATGGSGGLGMRKSSGGSRASGESRVRHYPSVTVVDDCLGQRSSVCLIGNGR